LTKPDIPVWSVSLIDEFFVQLGHGLQAFRDLPKNAMFPVQKVQFIGQCYEELGTDQVISIVHHRDYTTTGVSQFGHLLHLKKASLVAKENAVDGDEHVLLDEGKQTPEWIRRLFQCL
jgi:hypothetical protein